jgi:hypothetical protein
MPPNNDAMDELANNVTGVTFHPKNFAWMLKVCTSSRWGVCKRPLIEDDDVLTLIEAGFPAKEAPVFWAIRGLGRSLDQLKTPDVSVIC